MQEFEGKVAVVTGGGSGIGAELGRAFAREGCKVVLADIDEAAMARVAEEISAAGGEALAVKTDVTSLDSVRNLAKETLAKFGKVNVVCNNAGVAPGGPAVEASHKDWKFGMDVNVWGVVHGVEVFLPLLLENGEEGHVVNTASMAGLIGMEGMAVYCATKFAVVGLTESLARDLRKSPVGASVLCPMVVETPLIHDGDHARPEDLRNESGEGWEANESTVTYVRTIDVSEVSKRVLGAIRDRDVFILTHKEQGAILERRARKLAEAATKYATA